MGSHWDFFRGCQVASDNPWLSQREGLQKRVARRIAEVQDQLPQDASCIREVCLHCTYYLELLRLTN
jgi:hypothetical protein